MRKDETTNPEAEAEQRSQFNPLTLLISCLAAGVMGYIAAKYWNSPVAWDAALARYALMLACFAGAGIVAMNLLDNTRDLRFSIAPLDGNVLQNLLLRTILLLAVGLALEGVITWLGEGELAKSTVAEEDLAAYYVFAGAAEELMFRGVLLNLLARFVNKWLGLAVSAAAFCLAHSSVYGGTPYLMIVQFVLGLIWGYAYLRWRDITPNMLAHIVKNMMAVGSLLVL